MNERRTNSRLLCSELIEVWWADPAGKLRRQTANLEDISSGGVCLQSEIDIPGGTAVVIRHEQGEMRGTVRYCDFREFGYLIGIVLREGSTWTSRQFRPQHLVDLNKLKDFVKTEPEIEFERQFFNLSSRVQ